MSTKTLCKSSSVLIIAVVSVCALILSIGARRKSGDLPRKQVGTPEIQGITPRIENQTRSFELTQARRNLDIDGAGPELSLRNAYDKNITVFAVSVNGLIIMTDFAYSENEDHRAIAPGAVYTRTFGNVRRAVDRGISGWEDFDIKVLAVVFYDESSDGDEKVVSSILYDRLKSKRLLTRIVDLLSADLDSRRTIDDATSAELISRISSLSSDPGDASDTHDVLRWFDQSDHSLSPRERIVSVKETCENLVARL